MFNWFSKKKCHKGDCDCSCKTKCECGGDFGKDCKCVDCGKPCVSKKEETVTESVDNNNQAPENTEVEVEVNTEDKIEGN